MIKEALTYDDVLIVPKFSDVPSRKDVSLKTSTSKTCFEDIGANFPVISANMDTVTDANMAKAMLKYGGQACLHRFCSIEDNIKMFKNSQLMVDFDEIHRPMVSIGIGKRELERAEALYANNATTFIIDVAHGAQQSVVDQVKSLREIVKNNGAIIVGNFASGKSMQDFLEREGNIQGVKIGVGPGAACLTRVVSGIGYPQFSAVLEISRLLKNTGIPTIADGGLKNSGDIAKALAAGASMVMMGSMLAGTDESPGEFFYKASNGNLVSPSDFFPKKCHADGSLSIMFDQGAHDTTPKVKKYRGSASKEAYEAQGKEAKHRAPEGDSFFIPYKGSVARVLLDIEGGLRSAMTYVGASTLDEFRSNAEFVRITNAGYAEGLAHGKKN